jgi:hypothetical protein
MDTFTLEKIGEIDGEIEFSKLIRNDKCEINELWNEALKNSILAKELVKIQVTMQQISEMRRLPEKKFKDITPKKGVSKEYEIKTEHLRVYCFYREKTGMIVVSGGIKSKKQQSDINRFRAIKKEYLESLKVRTIIIK